ncbi:GPI-anchored surface protein, putative [Bodo saltans]|uniref:GPI-anchored surface protein, putative n=1 Tax=Bodo saltans TaxID=75058 RepID=A0A0S4J906_BODSA|nr:GPI-anchored surface protein, putative [Bodo saltans]|eukprot:CUG85956.1 GPI-anchored surface protein, putative [Bodo saltans]
MDVAARLRNSRPKSCTVRCQSCRFATGALLSPVDAELFSTAAGALFSLATGALLSPVDAELFSTAAGALFAFATGALLSSEAGASLALATGALFSTAAGAVLTQVSHKRDITTNCLTVISAITSANNDALIKGIQKGLIPHIKVAASALLESG